MVPYIFQTAAELLLDVTDTMVTAPKVTSLQNTRDCWRGDTNFTTKGLILFKIACSSLQTYIQQSTTVGFQQPVLSLAIFYATLKEKRKKKKKMVLKGKLLTINSNSFVIVTVILLSQKLLKCFCNTGTVEWAAFKVKPSSLSFSFLIILFWPHCSAGLSPLQAVQCTAALLLGEWNSSDYIACFYAGL